MSQRRSKRIIMGVGTVTRLSQHSNAGYLPGVHFTNVWDSAPAKKKKKRIWRCTGNSQMLCTINIFWMGQAIVLRDRITYESPRSSFVAVHTNPISENWIYRYWKPNYLYLLIELPISVNLFYLPISVNSLFPMHPESTSTLTIPLATKLASGWQFLVFVASLLMRLTTVYVWYHRKLPLLTISRLLGVMRAFGIVGLVFFY